MFVSEETNKDSILETRIHRTYHLSEIQEKENALRWIGKVALDSWEGNLPFAWVTLMDPVLYVDGVGFVGFQDIDEYLQKHVEFLQKPENRGINPSQSILTGSFNKKSFALSVSLKDWTIRLSYKAKKEDKKVYPWERSIFDRDCLEFDYESFEQLLGLLA